MQPTTFVPLPSPPDNGEDGIYVLIPDEFVGPPFGFFRKKKSFDFGKVMSRQKGRKGDGKGFFFKKKFKITTRELTTHRTWYPSGILGQKHPRSGQVSGQGSPRKLDLRPET